MVKIGSEHESEKTKNTRAFSFGIILSQFLGFLSITLVAIWMASYGVGELGEGFSWSDSRVARYHPIFMVVGLVFFQGEAIIAFRLFRHEKKIFSKLVHALCHAAAAGLNVAGIVAIFKHKNKTGGPSMMSPHSWMGIAITCVFLLQFLIGFISFLFPKISSPIRAWYLPIHRFAGLTIFSLSVVQASDGITNWQWSMGDPACAGTEKYCAEVLVVQFLQISLAFYAVSVVFLAVYDRFKRAALPDD